MKYLKLAILSISFAAIFAGISGVNASAAVVPKECLVVDNGVLKGMATDNGGSINQKCMQIRQWDVVEFPSDAGIKSTEPGAEAIFLRTDVPLKKVVFPEGMEVMGRIDPLRKENNYTNSAEEGIEFVLPSTLKYMSDFALNGSRLITKITMKEGLISIGQSAFMDTGLKEIEIPSTVKYIGYQAFGYFQDNLKSITFKGNPQEGSYDYETGVFKPSNLGIIYYRYSSQTQKITDDILLIYGNIDSEKVSPGINCMKDGCDVRIYPATSLTIKYVDESGNEIQASNTVKSKDGADVEAKVSSLLKYLQKTNASELTNEDLAYVHYYAGLTETFNAPEIAGYTKLDTSKTITLQSDASKNVLTFVYKKDAAATETPKISTPNTGVKSNAAIYIISIVGITIFAAVISILKKAKLN